MDASDRRGGSVMSDVMSLHQAAYNLAPGMVEYAEDSYESIRWRCDDPPSKDEVEAEAARVALGFAWRDIRAERDARLVASDWTQIPDAPVDAAAWAKYRQSLRDLPAKIKDPTREVKWPTPPGMEA